jgi:hypothetical protein
MIYIYLLYLDLKSWEKEHFIGKGSKNEKFNKIINFIFFSL